MGAARKIIFPDEWIGDRPWIDHPDADIEKYVASLHRPVEYDLEQKLKDWKRDGVVIFEGAVSDQRMEAYLAELSLLMRNFQDYDIPIEVKGQQLSSRDLQAFPDDLTGVKLNQMHCFSKAAAQLSLTPQIVDFLGHVFRAPASVCQSLTFWRGSEQPIHIDYPYVRQQKSLGYLAASWVPLEDVHPDSGPLAYYPGAHNVEVSGFFDWGGGSIVHDEWAEHSPMDFARYLWARMSEQGIQPRAFCPKRGDVLIWHGNLPHEGMAVKDASRTRKSYVTHYTSDWATPDFIRNHTSSGRPVGLFENGAICYRPPWCQTMPALPSWEIQAPGPLGQLTDKIRQLISRFK